MPKFETVQAGSKLDSAEGKFALLSLSLLSAIKKIRTEYVAPRFIKVLVLIMMILGLTVLKDFSPLNDLSFLFVTILVIRQQSQKAKRDD